VAIPVLGVVGILQVGKSIAAPPAVGGTWDVEAGISNECIVVSGGFPPKKLEISQSGRTLRISLNEGSAFLDGSMTDMRISAHSNALSLDATVEEQGGSRHLVGSITMNSCAPITWQATRRVGGAAR
jgi:hypothetical protein